MILPKSQIVHMLEELPDQIEVEELMYRLYLRQKIEAAEDDVRYNRTITHENVIKETTEWFK